MSDKKYPLYEMLSRENSTSDWRKEFFPLAQAGALYDSGWVQVKIGNTVLLDDKPTARSMTDEDRSAIRDAADVCSASK